MIPELTPEEWLEEAIKDSFIIKYELSEFSGIEVVGTGATGLVHRAFLRKLQNHVALKSFEFSKKFTNKEFVNELKLHNKAQSHENIINFYGLTKMPNASTYTLVMEYANNGTLKEYLKENKENPRFDWEQKIKLAKQLADAISFLHHNNIVHRDLKSDNVLVSNGNIKLSDFGISRRLTESTNLLTRAFGSARYSDPEHLRNPEGFSRTKKSDVYGLGMLLWEISSGTIPYKGFNTLNLFHLIANKHYRETPVKGSPRKYVQLYQIGTKKIDFWSRCWNFILQENKISHCEIWLKKPTTTTMTTLNLSSSSSPSSKAITITNITASSLIIDLINDNRYKDTAAESCLSYKMNLDCL
ncbi:13155_t:CDS:2 [Entrophospora sp. SA101]|nr:13155_t:CDS:2 [Entrophospora sp. SA101]